MYQFIVSISILLSVQVTHAQTFRVNDIPEALSKNSERVIRQHDMSIVIHDISKMDTKITHTETILENGSSNDIDLVFYYNNSTKIKSLKAWIIDANGNEIKTIRKRDFRDYSTSSGAAEVTDGRIMHYSYTSPTFPITYKYVIENVSSTTGFIPEWKPLSTYNSSVESSNYRIIDHSDVGLKIQEKNIDDYENITSTSGGGITTYSAKNLPAIKKESYAPEWHNIEPTVSIALSAFQLEKVQGRNTTWGEFGKWYYNNLLMNQSRLPSSIQAEIDNLTSGLSTNEAKAKAIYQFVQDRSRYISVQLGIGGWQPIAASQVHNAGYGDCKGLTNYTMALMKHAGIEAYYSIIHAGREKENMSGEMSRLDGNHVILCLPDLTASDTTWLECTSQTNPFGYLGTFTDDRSALIIKPDGGYLRYTTSYGHIENVQHNENSINLTKDGDASISHTSVKTGQFFGLRDYLKNMDETLEEFYKDLWVAPANLTINQANFSDDNEEIRLTEEVTIDAPQWAHIGEEEVVIDAIILREEMRTPSRIRKRKLPVYVPLGRTETEVNTFNLPDGYTRVTIPEEVLFETDFGSYHMTIEQKSPTQVIVTRTYKIFKGTYPAETYNDFRDFIKNIKKKDQTKLLINTKS